MLSIVLAAVLIAPTAWVPAENNAAVSTAASSEVVYVSAGSGNDSSAGTNDAPLKTLGKAFEVVADGGTVQILGTYETGSWGAHGKTITITGGKLSFTEGYKTLGGLGDTLIFKDIEFAFARKNERLFANGCKLTIGEGVVTTDEPDLYGGCDTGTLNGDTYLEVYSGNWRKIFGGGNDRPTKLNGSTHVVVGGNVNKDLDVSNHKLPNVFYGGGNGDTITGSTNITVTGSARAIHVYGGGAWSQNGNPSVGAGTNVVVTDSAKVMSVWGGSNFGGSTDCTAQLKTNVLMTGGTVEQIFGGNNKANLTGNVDVKVLGGTVTRRIYGGNYNETIDYTAILATSYSVNGNVKLTIGGDAKITFTGSSDQGIFARSRNNPKSDDEIATIIFDDENAYTTYNEKIGSQDAGSKSVMGDVTAADSIHYYTYTADDEANTITATCNICETSHSATATLSVVGEGPFAYTGKEIECAKVEYSTWELAPLEIEYTNNVEEGTATATCTKNGVSVSVNFEIKSTVLSGKKISILGDSISTYEGVSNNASYNKTIGLNNRYYATGTGKALPTQDLTYWQRVIDKYGMELCVNNSTGGGKVAADVEKNDGFQRLSGIKRSTELHNNAGQEPDIIVVYLGTNDLEDNDSVSFRSAYKKMLDNILERYENAELFCFTLLPGREYQTYETRVDAYNDQIKKVVKGYEERVTLVDMYTESGIAWNNLSLYTCDYKAETKYGLHPDKDGMALIAKVLERALLDEFEPASLPNTPDTYFDLKIDWKNNVATDEGTNKATIQKVGKGSYTTKTVVYKGQTCEVPVFYAEKDTSSNSYLDVTFNNFESTSDAMKNWIFDANKGITFEAFFYVANQPSEWSGIMSNINSGGISLHAFNESTGNSNFFIGINDGQGSKENGNWKTTYNGVDNYRYKANYSTAGYYENIKANKLNTGTFVHVVGTYDQSTNMMSLYHDGKLIDSGSYGAGPFRPGNLKGFNRLGIGTDISATGESLDDTTSYAIADARIYSGSLTAAQVQQEYENRWNEVLETATGPDVYFDLDFKDADGTETYVNTGAGKATFSSIGDGTITTKQVFHNGQLCEVPVYSAPKDGTGSSGSYLDVNFDDLTTEAQMKNWIFDNGITFECFIHVDELPTSTAGFMSNIHSGGIGFYSFRGRGELTFRMGTSNAEETSYPYNTTYAHAFPAQDSTTVGDGVVGSLNLAKNYQTLNVGKFTHVVGTYDTERNVLSIYKDGQLISEGAYSQGGSNDFLKGNAKITKIGLGCNIASTGERMSQYTSYAIADARVYSGALTAEQVAVEYNNRWKEVESNAVNPVTQLDDLKDYADITTGSSQELEGLPTYYSGGEAYGTYEGSNTGDRAAGGDNDNTLHAFSNSTKAAYVSYLKALEKAGWEQYSNSIKENNLFATYTKDGKSVYAYYIANKETTYIVASKTAYLENKAEEYEKVCEPLFTELKNISSSQCEILRLSDGRFIIIDSGMTETDHYQAKNIYKTLKKQNVLNKITIAAWIVTHAHTDHMDACADFLKVYGNAQVEVEEIIFNFPNKVDREDADPTNQPKTTPVFFEALAIAQEKWPDMKIITCHTGQEYQIADATIEILHTPEDYFPTKIKDVKDGLNDSSVVFRVKIAGQSIMILGDAGTGASNGVITMWGDYLKSDFVQMAHHGMNGGIVPVYEHIDPTVVTIPAVRHLWELKNHDDYIGQYNPTKWVLDNISGNIKEICIAGLGTYTFTLPYTPKGKNAAIIGAEQNGYDLEEGAKVKAEIPTPYADVYFEGTEIKVSGKANNTVDKVGGSVGEQTVYYKGQPYTVTAYRGEKTDSNYQYMKLTMNDISATDATGIAALLTGGNGHTLEAFFALDEQSTIAGGVISGCYSGGVTIYARKNGVIGYQLGSKNGSANKYIHAAETESTKAINNYTIPFGKTVVHVVATYDEVNHKLNLYRNGVLMSSADYSAEFNAANVSKMAYNTLGIGANIGDPNEAIGRSTGYTMIKSRVYDESLNAEQVAASYWNCIKELTGSEEKDIYEQQTVSYTRDEANKFISKGNYPRKEGYVFGGWYTTADIPEFDASEDKYEASVEEALKYAITTELPKDYDKDVYALFVPEDVMTVKAQISQNVIDNPNDETGSIRFVTTVDSLLYQQAGFTVDYINSSGTPKNIPSVSNKVYNQLHAVDASGDAVRELTYLPTQFCSVSKYFKACTVINLSNKNFGREFTVTPFWVTMDGSYVYGEPVIKSISQSPNMLK